MQVSDTASASALYDEGRSAAMGGDYQRATTLLVRALDKAPERADIARDLGRLFASRASYQRAVTYFDQALEAEPGATARDHYDHGACLSQLREHQRARVAYERALAMEPDWLLALDNLAVTLQCLGHLDDAEGAFRRVLELSAAQGPAQGPDERPWNRAWTLRNLASLLVQTERLDPALAAYREALESAPHDPITHRELAKALHLSGDSQAAEDAYRQALESEPGDLATWCHLGDLLLALERAEDAEEAFNQALTQAMAMEQTQTSARARAEPLRGLGASLHLQKRFDEAMLTFQAALDLAPDNPAYRYHLAVLFDHMGHTDEAVGAYRATLEVQPGHLEGCTSLASILYRSRDFEGALAAYRKVLEITPEDVMARYLVAVLERVDLDTAPPEYVSRVFDAYAEDYDAHMTGTLGYRVPGEIRAVLDQVRPGADRHTVLDLGCGTGLAAVALADRIATAHGVDLAAEMLARARERGIYEALFEADILTFLRDPDGGLPAYDLIVAADVFVYIGELGPILAAARGRLAPGGHILFSVESREGDTFAVQQSGRFTHGLGYIERQAHEHGLTVVHARATTLRTESSKPVNGHVFALAPAS